MKEKLKNTITNIYALTGINTFVINDKKELLFQYPKYSMSDTSMNALPLAAIMEELDSEDIYRCVLDSHSQIFLYAIKSNKDIIILGPVTHHILSSWEIHEYKKNYESTVNYLVSCSENSTYAALSILISATCNKQFTVADLERKFFTHSENKDSETAVINQQLTQIDTFQLNHSNQSELEFFDIVENGDVNKMRTLLETSTFLYPSPVKEPLKNQEYMVVSLISLLCRAAISGNAPASLALAQSDAFLKLVSEAHTKEEITSIGRDAAITFTTLVAQNQSLGAYSYISVQCKKIIHASLFQPITLTSIAKELSVSKEHLATCFKKDYGITVTNYIQQKKTELACKLLASSDYSINEIAEYLSYHSTSYFIKVFKQNIGVTPSEYRGTVLSSSFFKKNKS